ncbi:MAG: MAPEG family protein [Rhizomicrobium sp.]
MHSLGILFSATITVLTVIIYFSFAVNVGRMRGKHGIKAPATSGHAEFERAFRVQMNTLEQLAVFLPLLWIATLFFTPLPWLPAAFGLVWIVGRVLYASLYMEDPAKRGPGFGLGALASLGLLLLSLIGIGLGFAA